MSSTSRTPCPLCNGPMWDNSLTKRNVKQPDHKCKNRECDGAVWNDSKKAAPLVTQGAQNPYEAGPYVPGLDGPNEAPPQAAAPKGKAIAVSGTDIKLMASCLEHAVKALKYVLPILDNEIPNNDIPFSGDNICSLAATLFIETRKTDRGGY